MVNLLAHSSHLHHHSFNFCLHKLLVPFIWSINWPIRANSMITPSIFVFVNSWFHPYGRSTSPFGRPASSLLRSLSSSILGSIHMVDLLAHSGDLHHHSFDLCLRQFLVPFIWSINWPIRANSMITPSIFVFVNSWFHPYGRFTSPFGRPASSFLRSLSSSILGSIHIIDLLAHSGDLHHHSFNLCLRQFLVPSI